MNSPTLYRKRLIPPEYILLKNDVVLRREKDILVTKWDTIRPKKTLDHGLSAFFWDKGIKVSKFYDHDSQFICWYCDIITYEYHPEHDSYVTIDLLADVLVYPDGTVKVVDLDELADARTQDLISEELLLLSLHQLNDLLQIIYSGRFGELTAYIDEAEEKDLLKRNCP